MYFPPLPTPPSSFLLSDLEGLGGQGKTSPFEQELLSTSRGPLT